MPQDLSMAALHHLGGVYSSLTSESRLGPGVPANGGDIGRRMLEMRTGEEVGQRGDLWTQ